MSRFYVKTCLESNSSDQTYVGPTLVLANAANDDQIILFPINDDDRKIIMHMLEPESNVNVNDEHIGVFKTLVESWNQGDVFLSGIFLDEHDGNVVAKLIVSGIDGEVVSISSASFHQAIILSAYQKILIHMSDRLIESFTKGALQEADDEKFIPKSITEKTLPINQDVLRIAKQIMLGDQAKEAKEKKALKKSQNAKKQKDKTAKKKTPKKT